MAAEKAFRLVYACRRKSMSRKDKMLLEACKSGNMEKFEKALKNSLFSKAADLNAADKYGYTALMEAINCGQKEIALKLIKMGADVSRQTNSGYETALLYAAKKNYGDVVKELFDHGAKNFVNPLYHHDISHSAIAAKAHNALAVFIQYGLDIVPELYKILGEVGSWGRANGYPVGKKYPQYDAVRTIGLALYRTGGYEKLVEIYNYVKGDGTDSYTYLSLLWNHLADDDGSEIWQM